MDIERVKLMGDGTYPAKEIRFEALPDVEQYEALVFGSPVEAFSLSRAMKACLSQIGTLDGKKVALLVTQFFPYPWMGGNRAIREMRSLCESKGADVCGTGVVNWSNKRREKLIVDVVEKLGRLF